MASTRWPPPHRWAASAPGEALPALLTAVQKRSMLGLRKSTRGKVAALHAIAKIDTPAAREALAAVALGKDEMAEEARRILASG